jgi:hypothetical protein
MLIFTFELFVEISSPMFEVGPVQLSVLNLITINIVTLKIKMEII